MNVAGGSVGIVGTSPPDPNQLFFEKPYATQRMPALTAGGNREALIATPTRELAESSNTDTATPSPEKNAMGNPTRKF